MVDPETRQQGAGSAQTVRSVERALEILTSFSLERPEMGITELAQELKLSKSTVHRLLTALQDKGFVQQNPENQKYSLGLSLLHLGYLVAERLDLKRLALPIMRELQVETGETVNLNVIRGDYRVCIEKVESHQDLRHFVEIGKALPLYLGASGKILLAYMPKQEVADILERAKSEPIGGNTIPNVSALMQELEAVRGRGYATSSGERVEGAASVSAPVRDSTGRVIASLTVSGPTVRFTPHKVLQFVDRLMAAATELSRSLGYDANRAGGRHL